MGIRKKKNIIILTICMVISFIVYQLYFFLSITSSPAGSRVVPVFEHDVDIKKLMHVQSESDKYINLNGVIKGVLYYNMPRYRPNSKGDFKCLNSEQFIPFEQVNDDYCDCEDASDEPSTDACVNGTFYCDTQSRNKRASPNMVPSNNINDGICDCCDGSDEWLNKGSRLLTQANKRHYRYYGTQCLNSC